VRTSTSLRFRGLDNAYERRSLDRLVRDTLTPEELFPSWNRWLSYQDIGIQLRSYLFEVDAEQPSQRGIPSTYVYLVGGDVFPARLLTSALPVTVPTAYPRNSLSTRSRKSRGMSRRLLKFSGGSCDDYAT
jgi:hypothetical protein